MNLSQTNLALFSVEALRGMKKLRILDFSFNHIQTLDFGSVVLNDLNTLVLDGNQLVVINWIIQANQTENNETTQIINTEKKN